DGRGRVRHHRAGADGRVPRVAAARAGQRREVGGSDRGPGASPAPTRFGTGTLSVGRRCRCLVRDAHRRCGRCRLAGQPPPRPHPARGRSRQGHLCREAVGRLGRAGTRGRGRCAAVRRPVPDRLPAAVRPGLRPRPRADRGRRNRQGRDDPGVDLRSDAAGGVPADQRWSLLGPCDPRFRRGAVPDRRGSLGGFRRRVDRGRTAADRVRRHRPRHRHAPVRERRARGCPELLARPGRVRHPSRGPRLARQGRHRGGREIPDPSLPGRRRFPGAARPVRRAFRRCLPRRVAGVCRCPQGRPGSFPELGRRAAGGRDCRRRDPESARRAVDRARV
ncbi:MAG: Myo-inositol 2-dehydrogenase, partial [uncultured Thermomicrobiales bacterium]